MSSFSSMRHLNPTLSQIYSSSSCVQDKPGYFAVNHVSPQGLLPLAVNTAELKSNSGLARMPDSFFRIFQAQFQINSTMMI